MYLPSLYDLRSELELIIIVDNTKRKARNEIRNSFHEKNIPCVVTDSNHFGSFLPAELIIITENYLLDDVKYVGEMYGKLTYCICDENKPLICSAEEIAISHFNGFGDYKRSKITVKDGKTFFCGRKIKLTKTEQRILNMFLYSDKTYTAEAVAAFCLGSTNASACTAISHISKLNAKSKRLTGFALIKGKRYEGYTLNMI